MSKSDKAERRAFMFDVRAEQDGRGSYIEGRPVVYGKEADIGGRKLYRGHWTKQTCTTFVF